MARPKTLKIADIRLDGDTQVRCSLDEATVADYTEAIRRGDKLPPITAYHDGSHYWLADGFHRVAGARSAGQKEIAAHVEQGTRQEAAWAALAANKTNGLRMSQADRARAIKRALTMRPQASNAAIAKHIGCSDMTVAKYRTEMESGSQIGNLNKRTGVDGKTYPAKKAPAPIDDDPPPPDDDDDQPPVIDDLDSPPAADYDEPPADVLPSAPRPAGGRDAKAPAGLPLDHAGNRIPRPEIAEAFRRDEELVAICTAISRLKGQIVALAEKHDPLVAYVTPSAFEADANNMRRHVSEARPHAVCPYCGGDGCKSCRRTGWVNESTWNASPEDMRAMLQSGGKGK